MLQYHQSSGLWRSCPSLELGVELSVRLRSSPSTAASAALGQAPVGGVLIPNDGREPEHLLSDRTNACRVARSAEMADECQVTAELTIVDVAVGRTPEAGNEARLLQKKSEVNSVPERKRALRLTS